jgi:hypothetical protein
MSSVTVSYSDLDARTEFVLNRVAFLESVTEVLQDENTSENKQKVAVWRDNNYIALIVRCIMDPNQETFDRAIWATGNLLVSDDTQVATMTRTAITEDVLNRLVQLAGSFTLAPTVCNGVLYLLSNLSRYSLPIFFTEAVGNSLLKTVLTDKRVVNMNLKAQIDFLEAIKNIAKKDPDAINEHPLIDALFNPDQSAIYSRVFHIIGALAEQDSKISPLGICKLMTYFTNQLAASEADISHREMLWVLSNIMIEPTAPVLFVGEHNDLKSLVESIAWKLVTLDKEEDEDVGYDALFVLVNFIHGAKYMSEECQKNLTNDLGLAPLFAACLIHENDKVAAVARKGFDLIAQLRSTFYPDQKELQHFVKFLDQPVEAVEAVETHCDETETDTDDAEKENDGVVTIENDVSVTICEKPVPSASDLVLGTRRGNESAVVRRVVSLLVNSAVGEWIEVPSEWTLTISDLTTLQHLGYVIKDGYVGINPEIYCTY